MDIKIFLCLLSDMLNRCNILYKHKYINMFNSIQLRDRKSMTQFKKKKKHLKEKERKTFK